MIPKSQRIPVPSLYELSQRALTEAFALRCEYLLSLVGGTDESPIPTPMDQNCDFIRVVRQKPNREFSSLN